MNRRLALLLLVLAAVLAVRLVDADESTTMVATVAAVERPAAPPSVPETPTAAQQPDGPPRTLPWPVASDPFQGSAPEKRRAIAPVVMPAASPPIVLAPAPPAQSELAQPTVFGVWRADGRMLAFLASTPSVASAAVGDRVFAQYRVEAIASGAVTLLDETSGERLTLAAPRLPDERSTASAARAPAGPQ